MKFGFLSCNKSKICSKTILLLNLFSRDNDIPFDLFVRLLKNLNNDK